MTAAKFEDQASPGIAYFIKIGIFWFIVLHAGTIVLNSVGLQTNFLPRVAAGGFAIQSLLAISYLLSSGSFSRFLAVVFTCVLAGFGIFFSRSITREMGLAETRDVVTNMASSLMGTLTGAGDAFWEMGPVEHLAEAARLIFEKNDSGSLVLAQRHLRAIPPGTPQYNGARRLLQVAAEQAKELARTADSSADLPPVQILRRQQKDDALVITLRNNSEKPIRNIAYHVSFFEERTGEPLGDGMRSRISDVLNPQQTWTFEVPTHLAGRARAAFSLVDWEVDTGS